MYEDENTFAFLDIHPVNKGHTLVIPKKHAVNIYDIEESEIAEMVKIGKKLALKIREVTKAEGMNIHMNNEKAGGQAVFHAHIHLIPRYIDDGLLHWPSKKSYQEGEAEEFLKKINSIIS